MNCFSKISSHIEAICRRSSHVRAQNYLYGTYACPCTRNSALTRFGARQYSGKAGQNSSGNTFQSRQKRKPEPAMESEREKNAFYVIRKGDLVGVYRSLSDCQAQVGLSICDPPVSVFKGHRLCKKTEEYLASRGLKDAIYSIGAEDMNASLFGPLIQCPSQANEVSSLTGVTSSKETSKKRSQLVAGLENERSCILSFAAASKGDPRRFGAGAVLLADDGSLICKLRQGMAIATNYVAKYQAILLGLKYAHKKGFSNIYIQGDSKRVCMQLHGSMKAKDESILKLYKEVMNLKDKFISFQINHVSREQNSEANAQAKLAVTLSDGEELEEY